MELRAGPADPVAEATGSPGRDYVGPVAAAAAVAAGFAIAAGGAWYVRRRLLG